MYAEESELWSPASRFGGSEERGSPDLLSTLVDGPWTYSEDSNSPEDLGSEKLAP